MVRQRQDIRQGGRGIPENKCGMPKNHIERIDLHVLSL